VHAREKNILSAHQGDEDKGVNFRSKDMRRRIGHRSRRTMRGKPVAGNIVSYFRAGKNQTLLKSTGIPSDHSFAFEDGKNGDFWNSKE